MTLIADSGSTKTAWCLMDAANGLPLTEVTTKGMNPYFQTERECEEELHTSLLPALQPHWDKSDGRTVCFYGAGCTAEKCGQVRHAMGSALNLEEDLIEVHSDMVGAARSVCGHKAGIACIVGTGSNSCLYDGQKVVDNVSPLGYILGDEGSGAVLGRLFVGSLLKSQLSPGLKEKFLQETKLTTADIIERVYRQPFPNRFLASLSPFICRHLHDGTVHALVADSFREFFKRNVLQYAGHDTLRIGFVGSVAYYYRDVIAEVAAEFHLHLGRFLQSPMKGLMEYHCGKSLGLKGER
ncbi:MAG: ATPase [Bacteroidales bacterium]|nr:ATPase [Bacteroidales bacterium]